MAFHADLKPINEGQDLELDFGGHSSASSGGESSCDENEKEEAQKDMKRGRHSVLRSSQEDFSFPMEDEEGRWTESGSRAQRTGQEATQVETGVLFHGLACP